MHRVELKYNIRLTCITEVCFICGTINLRSKNIHRQLVYTMHFIPLCWNWLYLFKSFSEPFIWLIYRNFHTRIYYIGILSDFQLVKIRNVFWKENVLHITPVLFYSTRRPFPNAIPQYCLNQNFETNNFPEKNIFNSKGAKLYFRYEIYFCLYILRTIFNALDENCANKNNAFICMWNSNQLLKNRYFEHENAANTICDNIAKQDGYIYRMS